MSKLVEVEAGEFLCETASDCSRPEDNVFKLCYFNVSWATPVFNLSGTATDDDLSTVSQGFSFCECANTFGFHGPNCNLLSDTTRLNRGLFLCIAIWAAVIAIITFAQMIRYCLYACDRVSKSRASDVSQLRFPTSTNSSTSLCHYCWAEVLRGVKTAFPILFWTHLAADCIIINALLQLYSLFHPNSYEIVTIHNLDFSTFEDVVPIGGRLVSTIIHAASIFLMSGIVYIFFSWTEVFESATSFHSPGMIKMFACVKKFARIFVVVSLLPLLILPAIQYEDIIAVFLVICVFVFFFLVLIGRYLFLRTIGVITEDGFKKDIYEAVKLVKNTSLAMLLTLGFLVVLIPILYSSYGERDNVSAPGDFNALMLLVALNLMLFLVFLTIHTAYAGRLFGNLKYRNDQKRAANKTEKENLTSFRQGGHVDSVPDISATKTAQIYGMDTEANNLSGPSTANFQVVADGLLQENNAHDTL